MYTRKLIAEPLMQAKPSGFSLSEVVVRLAWHDERVRWDALMDHHAVSASGASVAAASYAQQQTRSVAGAGRLANRRLHECQRHHWIR